MYDCWSSLLICGMSVLRVVQQCKDSCGIEAAGELLVDLMRQSCEMH